VTCRIFRTGGTKGSAAGARTGQDRADHRVV